jgi:hypothetical protein
MAKILTIGKFIKRAQAAEVKLGIEDIYNPDDEDLLDIIQRREEWMVELVNAYVKTGVK